MTADILTRLQQANGPDRESDAEIAAFVRWHPYGPEHWINRSPEAAFSVLSDGMVNFSLPDETESRGEWVVPSFTDSIDASISLVERVLPNHTAGFQPGIGLTTWARVYYASAVEVQEVTEAKAKTAPLAILTALFLSLQKDKADDH